MKNFNEVVNRLVGKAYTKAAYGGISDSTLNRHIKSGDIPPPDIPARCNGEPNKWVQSTIDNDVNNKIEGAEKVRNLNITPAHEQAQCEKLLRQTIIDHSEYKDSEGNTGSDPNWFFFQLKKRISEAFGKHLNEIPENELSDLYDALVYVILDGEQSELTRREIKIRLYKTIETFINNNLKGEVN